MFEIQDKGNLIEAMAKLQHARDIWGSRLFLVVTGEKDQKKVQQLTGIFLAGTFHRLAPYLTRPRLLLLVVAGIGGVCLLIVAHATQLGGTAASAGLVSLLYLVLVGVAHLVTDSIQAFAVPRVYEIGVAIADTMPLASDKT